jgi:hypothetical protein
MFLDCLTFVQIFLVNVSLLKSETLAVGEDKKNEI